MCKFEDGFKFCSCKDDLNSTDFKESENEYVWEVFSILELEFAVGRFIPPSDIGQGLEVDWVLLNLNYENCFDFNYEPKELDNLIIYKKPKKNRVQDKFPQLSFIFEEGSWHEHWDFGGDKKIRKKIGVVGLK